MKSTLTMKYDRSITRKYTWYCQTPGVSWKTDPVIGWELRYAEGAWALTAPDQSERNLNTRQLKEAMEHAVAHIERAWEVHREVHTGMRPL